MFNPSHHNSSLKQFQAIIRNCIIYYHSLLFTDYYNGISYFSYFIGLREDLADRGQRQANNVPFCLYAPHERFISLVKLVEDPQRTEPAVECFVMVVVSLGGEEEGYMVSAMSNRGGEQHKSKP